MLFLLSVFFPFLLCVAAIYKNCGIVFISSYYILAKQLYF